MKIKITIKRPDVLYEAIEQAVDEQLPLPELSVQEAESVRDIRRNQYREQAARWFEYGEYVTLEFDTDADTMTVVPLSD